MTGPGSFSYDQVPYPNLSHYLTHPDNMAVAATLAGMSPANVEHCKVLELGCASGWNLIPMAYMLPSSQFTGIDLSHVHITEGHKAISDLGLENLRLIQMNVMDITPQMGQFDYIIAHGIFSWVPEPVKNKILQICKNNLSKQGVAFISYNTYPGWHLLDIPRGIMRYHTRDIQDPLERVRTARESLAFYVDATSAGGDAYTTYLKHYQNFLAGDGDGKLPKQDSALLHDELEQHNQPMYFYQFVEQAERHDLQYLAEADLHIPSEVQPQTLQMIREKYTSLIELEQALDFLENRAFRRTLLCHAQVPLTRRIKPDIIRNFSFSS
jgi:SAM-dependent methyltransferase